MEAILEVRNLTKKYSQFVLDDISFALEKGIITGFIGINGAGKTTTIKSILALNNIDSGSIKFWGKDLKDNSQEIRNRVGVVLGESCFYEELTISEMKNILAPAYTKWDDKVFHNYLDKFSLSKKQQISTLSKGMKMKVALSFALSHNADLLIMDEPTSGLDPLIRKHLMDELLEFMKQDSNRSIFISSHITSDLDKITDNLILIDNGKIIFNNSKKELLDDYIIVKGDVKYMNLVDKFKFQKLIISENNFTGLIDKNSYITVNKDQFLIEKPTIEDIMLAYINKN